MCRALLLRHANTGQQVRKGETIALMGSTGFATEPNLQFEVHPAAISPEGIKLLVFHRTHVLTKDVKNMYMAFLAPQRLIVPRTCKGAMPCVPTSLKRPLSVNTHDA